MRDWRGSRGWWASPRHLGDKYVWLPPVGGPGEGLSRAAQASAAAAGLLRKPPCRRDWECDYRVMALGPSRAGERAQSTQLGFRQERGLNTGGSCKSQR